MSDDIRFSHYFATSGLLHQNYDPQDLARSCHGKELTGFDALYHIVKPECHHHNIRNQRIIKQYTTCIWNNYANKNYFNDLANQVNRILTNQTRMPDIEHTPFTRAIIEAELAIGKVEKLTKIEIGKIEISKNRS
ncbi:15061_t:CDS:2 [Dentiscutata heterogama]|uniref:15061_t:CDS:1 n=1 Tax=Dentiscutata heterogama TaxID=1316150 RepID=A0ACA9MC71_9GLOM|nr:15061_t:CDS:2 [Dentiscutata heterogama]